MKSIGTSFLFIIFALSSNGLFAQDSSGTKFTRKFVLVGVSYPITTKDRYIYDVAFVGETKRNVILGLHYYSSTFKEQDYPFKMALFTPQRILNKVEELNFSVGKVKQIGKAFGVSLVTGPSFVHYVEPINIRSRPSQNHFGNFFGSPLYDYDEKKYSMLGWVVRYDMYLYAKQKLGWSMGVVFNINGRNPCAGVTLNMLLGKINAKKEEI